ncbi:MAG TPA: VTT domain-containing protein [Solirubrobacteraceae bacterium]|nr:VTT domain-containing protein [Solirubrobacteraceae bacterium]
MRPLWLAGAVALAVYLVVRRRHHGRVTLALGALAAIGAGLIGAGVIELPNVEHLIEEAGQALGKWTYLAVGILAFLETGAFIGLVAPGETTVIVGGLVAGQGVISLTVLIAIVWTCAVAGDLTSYFLGRRLGRGFMVKHGARVKITEERLEQVERFFERRGGMTILIGRFIGLVRAIAPFVAGASRMPLRKFLPYDIVGAGLWATTFCVLGFVFWRSFDQLTSWVSRGLFAFGLVVALIVGIVFLVRLQRSPELRAKTAKWIEAQLEKPLLRPFAPALRAAWSKIVRPAAGVAEGPARFVWNRLTPGDVGLEVTTLLAIGAVGSFTFFLLADLLDERDTLPGDALAADVAARLDGGFLADLAEVVTALGSLPVVAVVVVATTLWAIARRRHYEAFVLPAALLVTWAAVGIAKAALDRPRPADPLVEVSGAAYPSAHAAYAVFYVACAIALVRAGSGLAARFAVVTLAIVLAVALALSRVLLGASHLSDVEGGAGLAAAILAALGLLAIVVARLRHNVRPDP